jgi:DmsE family decaheme c-type cytochrome
MKSSMRFGFRPPSTCNRGKLGKKDESVPNGKLITRLASGIMFSALLCFAQLSSAEQPRFPNDEAYARLIDYVHMINGKRPDPVRADGSNFHHDEAFSALVEYVQQINADQPKLAAAQKAVPTKAVAPKAKLPNDGAATYVGAAACLTCHIVQAEQFGATLMGKIFMKNPRSQREKLGCETCHGPGSAHVKAGGGRGVGGIIAFRDDAPQTVEERNAVCLTCHESGMRTYWRGSEHETRGLACTNCHQIMKQVSLKNQFRKSTEIETCFQCHKDRRAQTWRSSHMPIREGKLTCSSCHNPHGTANLKLLTEATPNDVCYGCHAEKRGPFLFEHAPVRENCLSCHDPHGSIQAKLLLVSPPRLCQQCHSESGHPSTPQSRISQFAFNRACLNCHGGMIHGSNSPSGGRLHR